MKCGFGIKGQKEYEILNMRVKILSIQKDAWSCQIIMFPVELGKDDMGKSCLRRVLEVPIV